MSSDNTSGAAPAFEWSEEVGRIAATVGTFVVPTAPDDLGFARARAAAIQLARAGSGRIVLYDRSDERWTDTPNPEGPFGIDEVEDDRRPHLRDQMRAIAQAGIEVQAWYASVPALSAIIAAIQGLEADAVVIPEELDSPRIMDRLQSGNDPTDQIGHVLDQNLDRPIHLFTVASETDQITVTTTVDRTDRAEAAPSEVED